MAILPKEGIRMSEMFNRGKWGHEVPVLFTFLYEWEPHQPCLLQPLGDQDAAVKSCFTSLALCLLQNFTTALSPSRSLSTTLAEFPPCATKGTFPQLEWSQQQTDGLIIHILLAAPSLISIATTSAADAAAASCTLQTNLPFLSRLILTFPSTSLNFFPNPVGILS